MEITPDHISNLIAQHLTDSGEHVDELWLKLDLHLDFYPAYIVVLRKMEREGKLSRGKPTKGCNCSGDSLIKKP